MTKFWPNPLPIADVFPRKQTRLHHGHLKYTYFTSFVAKKACTPPVLNLWVVTPWWWWWGFEQTFHRGHRGHGITGVTYQISHVLDISITIHKSGKFIVRK